LPAEPLGRGRYRLLASPGLVEGVAAGDELELSPAEPPGTGSSGEGGQLCVWVYIPDPPPHHTDARLTQAAAALGGYLDGGNTRLRVLTVPVSAGFARVESERSARLVGRAGLRHSSTVDTLRSVPAREGLSLHIEYEITPEDLYAFQWRGVFASPRGRRARRNVYLSWLLAVVLFAIVPAIGADGFVISRISFGFILVATPFVFLLQWFLERLVVRHAIRSLIRDERPGRGQLGRHRVVLGEDGVIESTAVNESRTAWSGVDRVEQSADYIFIYTSPAAAHVIPKCAFSDLQEADAFFRLARSRKEGAD
jgi:hypothetical protein